MITASFAAAGVSALQVLKPGQRAAYSVTGTYTGTIVLEQASKGDVAFLPVQNVVGTLISVTDGTTQGYVENQGTRDLRLRFRSTGAMTGTAVASIADLPVGAAIAAASIGAVNGATVSAFETVDGLVRRTVIQVQNLPLTLADAGQGAGVKIYDFPEGRILMLGAVGAMAMITTSVLASTLHGGVTCKWGVGSTIQANATLATTEQDLIPVTTLVASATINVTGAQAKASLAAALQLDGTTTPVDAFLNVSIPTGTDIDANATVLLTGTIQLTWINLGDY